MEEVIKENELSDLSIKSQKYYCEKCKYITNNKKDYNKHLFTNKHSNQSNHDINKTFKCSCGIICNSRTTIWRHKKNCSNINNNIIIDQSQENIINLTKAVLELTKSNKELLENIKNK